MSTLYVELLGSPRFSVDARELPFARRRSKALAIYAICTERRVTREELADLFWPDALPARAMASLRTVLSEVRSLFHGAYLHAEGNVVFLDPTQVTCDLLEFRRLIRGTPTIEEERKAAGLWKGGFLKGFHVDASSGFYDWQLQEERNVFSAYKALLRSLYAHEIGDEEVASALDHARECLSLDNFDEESHRAVMYAYALCGDRKLALEQYDICRRIMMDEFESQVEDETEALVHRIRSGDIRKVQASIADGPHTPRLAILPFHRMHLIDQETHLYLHMVMEALEDFLAVIPELRIISRTSTLAYKNSGKRLSTIAAELQADYIIEGFMQADGPSLVIEGRLVQATTDEVVAIKQMTVSSLAKDPALVARNLGEAVITHFGIVSPGGEDRSETDARANDREDALSFNSKLKLQAKHLLRIDEEATCLKAVELYREAVRNDPSDAEAWAGIGSALLSCNDKGICFPNRLDHLFEIKRVAEIALEIEADEPTALTIMGNIVVLEDWDFSAAEGLYRKALRLLPHNTRTMCDYAELCIMTGRLDTAWKLSELISSLDPVNHHNFKIRFWLYLARKEFVKAEEVVQQQFLLYPAYPLDRILHGHILLIRGDAEAALKTFDTIGDAALPLTWYHALLVGRGYACAVIGRTVEARAIIETLKLNKSGSVYPYIPIAQVYIGLENLDSALDWIGLAVESHDPGLFFLAVNPLFAPLGKDPRLEGILRNSHIFPIKS